MGLEERTDRREAAFTEWLDTNRDDVIKMIAWAATERATIGWVVYVAVVHDRHYNPIIRVFSDRDRAIDWALQTFKDMVAHPDNIRMEQVERCLWAAGYGEEEDRAWVECCTLDEED